MTDIAAPRTQRVSWMKRHWAAYSKGLPLLLFLTFANAAVAVCYPLVVKWVIDGITGDDASRSLAFDTGVLVSLGVAQFGIYAWMQFMRARQNLAFEYSVRMRAFEHTLRLGPAVRSRFRTGDLVTRMTDDVAEKLSWFMCSGIGRVIEALAIIVFGVAMMIAIDPYLTIFTAGPLPILIALFVLTAGKLHKRYARVQERISKLNDSLESTFSGIRVVKALAAEEGQRKTVDDAIDQQKQAEIDAVRWQTVIDQMYGQVWQFAIIGVLLAGGAMVIRGEATLGTLVSFDMYVLMLVWPMFDVGQFLVRGRLSAVTIDRIAQIEGQEVEIDDRGEALPRIRHVDEPDDPVSRSRPELSPVRLRFESAGYTWPGASEPAVRGFDCVCDSGTITAIAGEIGCGKSSALLLVPRIVDPESGAIIANERSLSEWDLVEWRSHVGYAPQEPRLLDGTIRENVRFGRDWISEEEIPAALEVAQFTLDPSEFPEGLETQVGYRGNRLSGGQKQRVSLARAIAGRPSVLLLDDCTASLDARTEARVWEQILDHLPQCTTLMVTHRPATLRRADQILVLHAGRIEERGTFPELNRPGTHFANLYSRWELEERVSEA